MLLKLILNLFSRRKRF